MNLIGLNKFQTYYIPEPPEKFLMDHISIVRPYKTYVFGGYKAFISSIDYLDWFENIF